ncbi:MAG: hypothetical protein H0T68_05175, partial [Gemmatimonadales bacterium]|nr:hypothetical protein [Gemmatimonadales bacterium]
MREVRVLQRRRPEGKALDARRASGELDGRLARAGEAHAEAALGAEQR